MKSLLLIASLLSAPALADGPGFETYRTTVSTAGLDLNSAAGVRALDLRILHAASALCDATSSVDAGGPAKAKRCRDAALANVTSERARIIAAATTATRTANRD